MTRLFEVEADTETGEWLGKPNEVGKVDFAEFVRRPNTDELHHDTFEFLGETENGTPYTEQCCILVRWT